MRALALIALLASGCSLVLVHRPPDRPSAEAYPKCDTGDGPIVADVAFLLLYGLVAGGLASEDDDDRVNSVAIVGGLGGLHLLSAILGHRWTSSCHRMKGDFERDHPAEPVRLAPVKLGPLPVPPTPAAGELGGACFANRTCNGRLACTPEHLCQAGARGLEGMACFVDGSCSGELTCTSSICTRPAAPECAQDVHCPAGQLCHGGFCVLPPASR